MAHIIAAQGPFSREMNAAQLKMIGADYMVTKASGRNGGFDEKIEAAEETGAVPVIIGQPPQVRGMTLDEAVAELGKELSLPRRKVYVVGIGPGSHDLLTSGARTVLEECDAVIGAASVTEMTGTRKPVFREFLPTGIRRVLDENPSVRSCAVVMRGDTGFFSGAKKLAETLDGYDVTVIPGISSVSLLAARLSVSWDDASLISMHGRDQNIALLAGRNRKMFVLCGGDNTPDAVCRRLSRYGLGELEAAVGEKLSYPEEKITRGRVSELSELQFDPLSVLYIENPVPDKENLVSLASHGATMVLFLSTGLLEKAAAELTEGGYSPDTPAAIVYKASWEDEKVCRCTLATLRETAEKNGITKTALIVVGKFLEDSNTRSLLYDPGFSTEFREATK